MTRMFITRLTRGKVAIDVHGVRLWQSVFVPLKFFHFARNPFRDEASPVGVPLVEVVGAYPVGVWVTVLADIDRAGSFTAWRVVHVAAIVNHPTPRGTEFDRVRISGCICRLSKTCGTPCSPVITGYEVL